jgi:hypothetical protein
MSFFDFRLNSIAINNNRDIGRAEVKIFTFVTSSNYNSFLFEKLVNEPYQNKQKELIKTAAEEILSFKEIIKVENIKKKSRMNFGLNGYSLYKSDKIPESFDFMLCVMDDDQEIRDIGKFLNDFINHESFDKFSGNILKLISTTAAPQVAIAMELTKFITKVVSAQLMLNKDDQIGVYIESFDKYRHYSGQNFEGKDIVDLSNNCKVSYSIFRID